MDVVNFAAPKLPGQRIIIIVRHVPDNRPISAATSSSASCSQADAQNRDSPQQDNDTDGEDVKSVVAGQRPISGMDYPCRSAGTCGMWRPLSADHLSRDAASQSSAVEPEARRGNSNCGKDYILMF